MSSDRRIAANRTNAQKSTGPKTDEGKTRSRRNALKHGLAGDGDVLPIEDEVLFAERLQLWTNDARPQGDIEAYLVASAALASVRLDRCARHEFAVMARKRRRATRLWESRRAKELNALIMCWDDQPAETLDRLQESTDGCDWLIARWDEIDQELAATNTLADDQAALALRLLGVPKELRDDDDAQIKNLRSTVLVSPDHTETIDKLATLIAEEIDRLEDLREELWIEQDGPSLAEAINVATVDDTTAGERLRRYESASARDLHRCLARFADIRKQKRQARRQEEQDPVPPAGWYNSPEVDQPAEEVENTTQNELRNEPNAAESTEPPATGWVSGIGIPQTAEERAERLARRARVTRVRI